MVTTWAPHARRRAIDHESLPVDLDLITEVNLSVDRKSEHMGRHFSTTRRGLLLRLRELIQPAAHGRDRAGVMIGNDTRTVRSDKHRMCDAHITNEEVVDTHSIAI